MVLLTFAGGVCCFIVECVSWFALGLSDRLILRMTLELKEADRDLYSFRRLRLPERNHNDFDRYQRNFVATAIPEVLDLRLRYSTF